MIAHIRNVALALLLPLVVAACERGSTGVTEPHLTPQDISSQLSSVEVDGVKFKIVKGKYDGNVRTDSKEISDKGGQLEAAGHVLVVPKGAVSVPTLFSMTLVPVDASDGSQYIKVELTAFERDAEKKWTVDVGPRGFAVPVELRLTYSWMTENVDPAVLQTVWVKADGTGEAIATTLDAATQTVVSHLDHFSDYALAMP